MAVKGPFDLVCQMAEIFDGLGVPYALGGSMASSLLVDTASALKVDLFVVGDGLLDRMQIERRVLVPISGSTNGIWVTSAEDQVLRKLDWFRQGGSMSDRQWRDVVGILRIHRMSMDLDYLRASARELGLTDHVDEALQQAR